MGKIKSFKGSILAKILVNTITSMRLFGSIILIPLFINFDGIVSGIAALIFLATDCVDGFLARHLKAQTFFGCILDAISDKMFGVVCLSLLSSFNPIFIGVLFVEIGITIINNVSLSKGNNVQSSFLGKIKMILLSLTIILGFLVMEPNKLILLLNIHNSMLLSLLGKDPIQLTTWMALIILGADFFVFSDYIHRARTQSIEYEKKERITVKDIENSISDLEKQKKELLINNKKKKKTKDELLDNLFDTSYYLKHKNDSLRDLLYK